MSLRVLPYLQLMRLHRPIGIWLLLWPTLWAVWLAGQGHPSLKIVIIFILGTIVMRSAGCVINDIADRNFDGHVTRTKDRPLITGKIRVVQALILFVFLCLCALFLVLQLNIFTIKLSVVGLLLAIIYPFTKRVTYWPQLILGAAFAWSVPMAFAAQLNNVPTQMWLIYIIAILWPIVYDTIYAMMDRDEDRKIGVKSTALLFERYDRSMVGIIQLTILCLLAMVGWWEKLNSYYYLCLSGAAILFIYQQFLLKTLETRNYFLAFKNNNWVGALVFLGIFLGYLG